MSRKKQQGEIPINNYNVYFGFDIDVKKWFIEVTLKSFQVSSNIRWFDKEQDYIKFKKIFLKRQ